MRNILLPALLALACVAFAQRATPPAEPAQDVLEWNRPANRSACPDAPTYLWVQSRGGPACIRYFASEGVYQAPIAIVQFSGDRDDVMDLPPAQIPGNTVRARLRDAQRSYERAGVPWVFVARPGTYGSSGDHRARRQESEALALDAAVTALIERLGIGRVVLLGHSGGATAAASMLTHGRTGVACAVLTSGAYSLLERARMLGRSNGGRTDTTGSASFYDPLDHIDGMARDPERRIVLIGNRDDRNTPFALQEKFARALAAAGHQVVVMTHAAEAPEYHDLKDHIGPRMASVCARQSLSVPSAATLPAGATP
ncbi:alpha/beta hydrolase family protein [Xylophilus sp. ASV27]|uniref:alpha/beta hydrolase family protein n=1 Tax=Xylophilus sp. ASV27 TaxID=2795129 RepID=UPI0018EE286A|nr:alpha/beta hydrolase [Xylophilus sp. ASV27]